MSSECFVAGRWQKQGVWLPEFVGHCGSAGAFAFLCPARSLYLAGTGDQIASPQKPFTLMINLVQAMKR